MDLGDFEQDAWGTQLCSVWLQECLNLQVSDTRFKNMKNQKCGLGDWINMWKSLLCYPLALEATELWSFVIWSVSLCMCVYLVTTAFSWGSGPFFSIFSPWSFSRYIKQSSPWVLSQPVPIGREILLAGSPSLCLLPECMWCQIPKSILEKHCPFMSEHTSARNRVI